MSYLVAALMALVLVAALIGASLRHWRTPYEPIEHGDGEPDPDIEDLLRRSHIDGSELYREDRGA